MRRVVEISPEQLARLPWHARERLVRDTTVRVPDDPTVAFTRLRRAAVARDARAYAEALLELLPPEAPEAVAARRAELLAATSGPRGRPLPLSVQALAAGWTTADVRAAHAARAAGSTDPRTREGARYYHQATCRRARTRSLLEPRTTARN